MQNRVPLGTFKTKKEALQALAEYGANPYDIQNAAMTLAELYDKWTAAYFPTLESESSAVPSSQHGATATPLPECVLKTCVPATSRA